MWLKHVYTWCQHYLQAFKLLCLLLGFFVCLFVCFLSARPWLVSPEPTIFFFSSSSVTAVFLEIKFISTSLVFKCWNLLLSWCKIHSTKLLALFIKMFIKNQEKKDSAEFCIKKDSPSSHEGNAIYHCKNQPNKSLCSDGNNCRNPVSVYL